ncbi:hypothetical protein OH76DRAFT_551589 [Lentinus brumalis]|uniref:Uncharacterized protein n=1 Tax=Lentinus brumalis TaxID=2498619 RepID=A0A371DA11_9APHY|nr:hypothetical protein OH76DRAFT_551589 [Polyporus brumalis]
MRALQATFWLPARRVPPISPRACLLWGFVLGLVHYYLPTYLRNNPPSLTIVYRYMYVLRTCCAPSVLFLFVILFVVVPSAVSSCCYTYRDFERLFLAVLVALVWFNRSRWGAWCGCANIPFVTVQRTRTARACVQSGERDVLDYLSMVRWV